MTLLNLKIFWIFFKMSLISVGGVFGVLPELERMVVVENQWLTHQQFIQSYAIGQFVPGPNMAMCPLIGYWINGWQGFIAGFAGIYLGPVLVLSLGFIFYRRFKKSEIVMRAERALRPLVTGTLAGSAFHFWLAQARDYLGLGVGLSAVAVVIYQRFKVDGMIITFCFGTAWWLAIHLFY